MNERELLTAFLKAANAQQIEAALNAYLADNSAAGFEPFGRRPNNLGTIGVSNDNGRSLVERVTNMHDALLELEHERHGGTPDCRSPREAANAWLGVPEKGGLSSLTNKQRQDLAARAIVRLEPGKNNQHALVSVIDKGIGIEPGRLEETILSLNRSNKIQKHYLAGTYGQGGSSTFNFCSYAVIVSRYHRSKRIGFTLVKYEELPAEDFKTGRYVFLVHNDAPLEISAKNDDTDHGTIVRLFDYSLAGYTSPVGPNSIYGLLGRIMFDPVSAIRLENQIRNSNRTIKGVRNALNGAVDDGDEGVKRLSLDHHIPMFNVDLDSYGSIGIEYWVLARPKVTKKGKKPSKPAQSFVDSTKPVVLTHNGQNQGELTGRLIKDFKMAQTFRSSRPKAGSSAM